MKKEVKKLTKRFWVCRETEEFVYIYRTKKDCLEAHNSVMRFCFEGFYMITGINLKQDEKTSDYCPVALAELKDEEGT